MVGDFPNRDCVKFPWQIVVLTRSAGRITTHKYVTVWDAGQRSVAEKGRAVRMIRKQEMIFFHENALGAATQECATRALRERNPWRHLVSGRHRFVIFSVRDESINLADATRQCFLSWSKIHLWSANCSLNLPLRSVLETKPTLNTVT